MASERGDRGRLDADAWQRIGAVLDRVSDLDVRARSDALEEACRAEGVRVEDVRPYLEADDRSGRFPGTLDPAILDDALQAFAAEARSARLAPGTRLGPYEILSLIGVGGMGEVYGARDTRLNRTVALKRLTANVAASHEGRKRFEREAQATSTLNHPHICTLHDVGSHDGVEFLVMEFTEGETLAARLQRGALPMSEALQYGAQMAEALAAAHRHGIVHRDLKPANVMLTAHGVKLLDFGLAALRPPPGLIDGGHDVESTAAGTILGTLQYMSPEQLQGRPVDGRTDIFAVGAILYEMITGRKAFDADSCAGVVAAVLEHTPQPLRTDRPDVPAALEWAVAQCLAKVAEERWQSAADLARLLLRIDASRTDVDPQPAFRSARHGAIAPLAAAAVAVVAMVALVYFLVQREQPGTPLPYRFEISPPLGTSYEGLFAISPDGRRLAFTATDAAGLRSLWIRPLEALTAQRIERADGALYPFWSPDGGSVGFFADRKLKIVDLGTGTVRVLSDTGTGGGGTWNANGVILFADQSTATTRPSPTGLRRVSASGGVPTPVTRFEKDGGAIQAFPHFFPDGRHYLYMQLGVSEPGVYIGRLDADQPRRILPALVTVVTPQRITVNGPVRATYAAGHLFYLDSSDRALMAQGFDAGRLELTGDAVRIAEDVENSAPGLSAYDVSATGLLVYRPVPPQSGYLSQLAGLDGASRPTGRLGDKGPDQNVAVPVESPPPVIVLTNWPSLANR
ncbi:MAG TPA: protein kinase [Vicinamibacterales bacterium]